MFGPIGGWEVILILLLALMLFGPRKLPEIGRTLGQTLAQLRRAAADFKLDLEREIRVEELEETGNSLKAIHRDLVKNVSDLRRAPTTPAPAEKEQASGTEPDVPTEPPGDGRAGASGDD